MTRSTSLKSSAFVVRWWCALAAYIKVSNGRFCVRNGADFNKLQKNTKLVRLALRDPTTWLDGANASVFLTDSLQIAERYCVVIGWEITPSHVLYWTHNFDGGAEMDAFMDMLFVTDWGQLQADTQTDICQQIFPRAQFSRMLIDPLASHFRYGTGEQILLFTWSSVTLKKATRLRNGAAVPIICLEFWRCDDNRELTWRVDVCDPVVISRLL